MNQGYDVSSHIAHSFSPGLNKHESVQVYFVTISTDVTSSITLTLKVINAGLFTSPNVVNNVS